ncbi:hypothetical protein D3C72_1967780 [compost metagenome]
MARGADQQRVAVVLLARHQFGADLAGGARLVLDHEGLVEALAQFRRQQARDDVGHASGREGHHDGDGMVGIFGASGARGQAA